MNISNTGPRKEAMSPTVNCIILVMVLTCGLDPHAAESMKTSAQGQTMLEVKSENHLPETKRSAFASYSMGHR
jgi:hypothetical protein